MHVEVLVLHVVCRRMCSGDGHTKKDEWIAAMFLAPFPLLSSPMDNVHVQSTTTQHNTLRNTLHNATPFNSNCKASPLYVQSYPLALLLLFCSGTSDSGRPKSYGGMLARSRFQGLTNQHNGYTDTHLCTTQCLHQIVSAYRVCFARLPSPAGSVAGHGRTWPWPSEGQGGGEGRTRTKGSPLQQCVPC
jgi:hypothetical protein